jgi:uncharacterized membrane protein
MKRTFGALLTLLGIAGLIYAGFLFINAPTGDRNMRSIAIYGILGLIFFIAGVGLVRRTKDEG